MLFSIICRYLFSAALVRVSIGISLLISVSNRVSKACTYT